jgi:methionyl-tRNA synthetase
MYTTRYLVTSALPYVNNVPHLGHLIGCILPADVYTRYLKLKGHEAIYICGTDEHGTPTEVAAEKAGKEPAKWCDEYYKKHKTDYEWFLIDFTHFGRTSKPENHELTQYIFKKLHKGGYIFEDTVQHLYCEKCRRFLPDRYVEGTCPKCGEIAKGDQCDCGELLETIELKNPRCVICNSKSVIKESKHLFLDLPKFKPKLRRWLTGNKHWHPNVRNWALSLVDDLKPRAITRDLKWGIRVPLKGFEDKVFYVWFDAPIGYISITKEKFPDKWHDWWTSKNVKLVHFIGKDNIPFHTVIFPASLMGADEFILPYNVVGSEYLNYEGRKFSKSKGIGVNLEDARKLPYSPDYWRFVLIALAPQTHDADFSWGDFQKNVNELADVVGNFVHRTFILTDQQFNRTIPEPGKFTPADRKLIKAIEQSPEKVSNHIEDARLREALNAAMSLAREGNAYLNGQEPWKNKQNAPNTLYLCTNLCRTLAILFAPFIPESSEKIWKLLNLEGSVHGQKWNSAGKLLIKPNHELNKSKPLFKKIDDYSELEPYEKKFGGKGKEEEKNVIPFDDFKKLDLRVGTIKTAGRIEGSDRLYKLEVDLGTEKRTMVAGLVGHYKPEELNGMKAVVLTNLEPRTTFGIKSEGMVLAAVEGKETFDKVKLVTVDKDMKDGSQVM